MKYFSFVILITCSFLFSCSKESRESETQKFKDVVDITKIGAEAITDFKFAKGTTEVIKIPDNLEQVFKQSEVIDSSWVVKLETGPKFLIGQITQVEYHQERLYIFDYTGKALLIFDHKGKFIKTIRPFGKGPGEFVFPIWFDIDKNKNELLIYENKLAKILYFDLDGNFVREKHVGYRFSQFITLEDGSHLVQTYKNYNAHIESIRNYKLIKVDSQWNLLNRGFQYSYEHQGNFNLINSRPFQQLENEIIYWPPFSDTIYTVANDILAPRYIIDAGSKNLPVNFDFDLTYDDFKNKYGNEDYFYHVGDALESKDFLYFRGDFNKKTVNSFYSKKTKKLYCSTNMVVDVLPPFVVPLSLHGNVLISSLEASAFARQKEGLEKYPFSKDYKELLKSIDENDNPVLVFCRVKPF